MNFELNIFVSEFKSSQNFGYLWAAQNSAKVQKNTIILRRYSTLSISLNLDAISKTLLINGENVGG